MRESDLYLTTRLLVLLLMGALSAICCTGTMESQPAGEPVFNTEPEAGAPLSLRLQARKPRFLVGEGILIDIAHTAHADLVMETVELNVERTHLFLTALDERDDEGEPVTRTFDGSDYLSLHRVNRLTPISTPFEAPADSSWDSTLELFLYTRPLPAGQYRLALRYRYGDTAAEAVRTEPVDFEVVPAAVQHAAYRWFGGRFAREELASVWTARREGREHWFYQVASKHDPGAVRVASDLDVHGIAATAVPRLALLNDIAAMHFHRYVVWTEAGGVGWMKVQLRGKLSEPAVTPHGLAPEPAPRLLDPALQRVDGGLYVVLAGVSPAGRPALSVVEVSEAGAASHRLLPLEQPLGERAVMVWTGEERTPSGWIYHTQPRDAGRTGVMRRGLGQEGQEDVFSTPGKVEALKVEQWLGQGHVGVLIRRDDGLQEWLGTLEAGGGAAAARPLSTPARPLSTPAGGVLTDADLLDGGGGLALLLASPGGTVVLETAAGTLLPVPPEGERLSPPTQLIATPRAGIYLIVNAGEERGLRSIPIKP